ncbi:hypothetical protein IV417_11275 [Alphaproteobacteria bacterium KMM 3653]|uniref:HlyD family secretion protein n=1 Tax=Harenicola maris TaxID=2841044 RepID=A0AAP2G8Y8_9RHOB|nr:hypothetical protein [Harenicola maris]
MQTSAPAKSVRGWPQRRVNLAGLLWLIIAVSALALGLSTAALFLGQMQSIAAQSFPGTLRPTSPATHVDLPAGLPLQTLQVSEGERVTAGQTIATLDEAAITASREGVERRLLSTRALRACLLGEGPAGTSDHLSGHIEAEAETQLNLALKECDLLNRTDAAELVQFDDSILLLDRRRDLLIDYAHRTRANLPAGVAPNTLQGMRVALGIALSQTELTTERLSIEQARDTARRAIENRRITRSKSLTVEIETLLTRRALLERYSAAPRLTAPQTGRIAQVRVPPAGKSFDQSVTLLQVVPGLQSNFAVEANLPTDLARDMPLGTSIELDLLGFGPSETPLTGSMTGFAPGPPGSGTTLAKITLSEETQSWLVNPRNGLALGASATASDVRLRLPPQPLRPMLTAQLQGNLPREDQIWLSHLRRAFRPVSAAEAETPAEPTIEEEPETPPIGP